jgi:hypothetical protein
MGWSIADVFVGGVLSTLSALAGKGEPIVVRMHPPALAVLDAWIAKQKQPYPSRPEAVRRLVELGLKVKK